MAKRSPRKRSVHEMLTSAPNSLTRKKRSSGDDHDTQVPGPVDSDERKRRNRRELFGEEALTAEEEDEAPVAKRKRAAAVGKLTSDDSSSSGGGGGGGSSSSKESAFYVQTAIHQCVDFRREGDSGDAEDPHLLAVFAFIKAECALPDDLQNDTQKFGPLSGVSYEERAVSAYAHGLLDASSLSDVAADLRLDIRRCFVESDFESAADLIASVAGEHGSRSSA